MVASPRSVYNVVGTDAGAVDEFRRVIPAWSNRLAWVLSVVCNDAGVAPRQFPLRSPAILIAHRGASVQERANTSGLFAWRYGWVQPDCGASFAERRTARVSSTVSP